MIHKLRIFIKVFAYFIAILKIDCVCFATYGISRLAFVMEMQYVYCEVGILFKFISSGAVLS